jgi:hypothetical protein
MASLRASRLGSLVFGRRSSVFGLPGAGPGPLRPIARQTTEDGRPTTSSYCTTVRISRTPTAAPPRRGSETPERMPFGRMRMDWMSPW